MQRLLFWTGLAGLTGFAGLVLASGSGDGPKPSAVALDHGYPAGLYSDAEFSISDDAAVMVLSVQHPGQSMRLYGDGRLEIQTGDESFTRQLDRPRMLEIFRQAVDHGLAEFDFDVVMVEIPGATCPEGSGRITTHLNFTAYDRVSQGKRAYVSKKASLCAPESFPQVVQSQALIDLAAVLDAEIATARREGSIEAPPEVSFSDATFQLSSDPEEVILTFQICCPVRSMKLYGDGRLELRHIGKGEVVKESFDRELEFSEMVELVRLAVDHGFAEWDAPSLAGKFVGSQGAKTEHASGAGGDLYLESYKRGTYARNQLARSFLFHDIYMAKKHSPEVLQVQGLVALWEVLDAQFALAREEDSND